jgi:hypothetical protein
MSPSSSGSYTTQTIYTTGTGTSSNGITLAPSDITFHHAPKSFSFEEKYLTLEVAVDALKKTDEEVALMLTSPNEDERKYAETIMKFKQLLPTFDKSK